MKALTPHDISTLLLSLGVMLATARFLGELFRRFNQPAVIGEILAGIILGPTVLGSLWPAAATTLFPKEGPVPIAMHGLTTLAITLFLLVAGMEVDLSTLSRRKAASLLISLGGMIVPFLVGFVPAWFFPEHLGAKPDSQRVVFALFLATALSITALPVVAKMLMDLQLFRTDIGMTIIAAAVIDDLSGWLIFALILALIGQGNGADLQVWQTVLLTLAFVGSMLTIGRWLIDRFLPWLQAHTSWPGGVLGFALTLGLLCAAFTEWIGVHAIFGAFILGIALGDSRHLRSRTRATLDQFISFSFAPLFFASIGLRMNFAANFDLSLVVMVLVLATLGKVAGCTLAARLSGFVRREAWAIGFGMNARGAMEIILGLLALEAGLIGERLFVALVVMALVTSITSGSLIQRVLGRLRSLRFYDFASAKTFIAPLQACSGREAIAELAKVAAAPADLSAAAIDEAVWTREQFVGSAIGNGVAIPHARIKNLKQPIVALGISRPGLDFDAADGRMVSLILLILTPEQDTRTHLELLASIARTFKEVRVVEKLTEASNWTQFLAVLNTDTLEQGRVRG